MPITTTESGDLRPTMVAKPDMRFATTFISNKYRQYAVNGESLMDKATGEIFTKRLGDGRVVSFFQNKKYMYDIMMELRILTSSYPNYVFPTENDSEPYYINTDYDVMSFNSDNEVDISLTNGVYGGTDSTKFSFKVSKKSNGFFVKPTTRDTDKQVLDFIVATYNNLINYTGSNQSLLSAKEKLKNDPAWVEAMGVLDYTITVIMNDGTTRIFNPKGYFRYNSSSCILFPENLTQTDRDNAKSITITFNGLVDTKFSVLMNNASEIPSFNENLNKFKYIDGKILLQYLNIAQFVDSVSDITYIGKEFTIAMMDSPSIHKYMAKMSNLMHAPSLIVSPSRPDNTIWLPNAIWGETVRVITADGEEYESYEDDTEVDFYNLEQYLAKNNRIMLTNYSTNQYSTDDIFVEDKTGGV